MLMFRKFEMNLQMPVYVQKPLKSETGGDATPVFAFQVIPRRL